MGGEGKLDKMILKILSSSDSIMSFNSEILTLFLIVLLQNIINVISVSKYFNNYRIILSNDDIISDWSPAWIPPLPLELGGHLYLLHLQEQDTHFPQSNLCPFSQKEHLKGDSWKNWNLPLCSSYSLFCALGHFTKGRQKTLFFCSQSLPHWVAPMNVFPDTNLGAAGLPLSI